MDPRKYQVIILLILLIAGSVSGRVNVPLIAYPLVFLTSIIVQTIGSRWNKIQSNYWSSSISSLSLLLLFRVHDWWGWVAVTAICIGSKFVLRHQGKHFFNPSNLAIVLMLLLFPNQSWISPGQWGRELWLFALMLFMGSFIVTKSRRWDTTFFFMMSLGTLVLIRHLWLGDPLTIAFHRLTNGSMLIFSFLMISDPRTTPNSRSGRMVFCAVVASIAFYLQNFHYIREGLFYALALGSLTLPIINTFLPGEAWEWKKWQLKTTS